MSWIKNVFNKLISDEPENKEQVNNVHKNQDEIIEDEAFEALETNDLPFEQLEQQPAKKKDFKFPLYYDEESVKKEDSPLVENQPILEVENTDERPLVLRKGVEPQVQKSQYSPFASQQQVGRPVVDSGRVNYNPFSNSGVVSKKITTVEQPKTSRKKIPSFEERKRDVKETVQISQPAEAPPKKKFVPTDVPSPVHGFNKRVERTAYDRKVDELLVEERKRHRGTIADQLVQERLEKENRLATPFKQDVNDEIKSQAIAKEGNQTTSIEGRKTIVPKDIKPTDIVVEKVSFELSDVVTEIEVPDKLSEVVEALKPVVEEVNEPAVPEVNEPAIPEVNEIAIPEVNETVVPEVNETVVPEVNETAIPEVNETVVPEVNEPAIPEVNETVVPEVNETVVPDVGQHTVIAEAEAIVEAVVVSKQAVKQTEEQLPILIEAVQESEIEQQSTIQATLTEAETSMEEVENNVSETPVDTTRISKTPINVVMLKSDKAKLKANEEQIEQPLKITFPEWKKNPLKVMQSYGQITQLNEKATVHKAVEEVHPTGGTSQQVVEVNTSVAVMESQIEGVQLDEGIQSQAEAVVELSTPDSSDSSMEKEEVQLVVKEHIKHQKIEVTEETRPAAWSSYKQSLALLREPVEEQQDYEWMESQGALLKEVLDEFNIPAEIVHIFQGPTVTQFEITVGNGVKISKIKNLLDNFKLALAAREIRIEAPIPGKRTIGIEIPNAKARPVRLSEIVGNSTFEQSTNLLEVALGLDLTGQPVTFNLNDMPHGLIAGSTGSGKSVCINSILMSLIMKASPRDVKLMLIDPKMVELAVYDELPHLVSPVITDVKAATIALKWAVEEMERRYQLFHHMKVRHIGRYNEIVEEQRRFSLKMPYLVIVIDELADLMMMAPSEVEESICRITQKARACGIHLVLATQRPSVDVITGVIKSNIPTRIAFAVSSQIDSRTIIDKQGAERLLGKGDMLYLPPGESNPVRLQGTFVTDEEIEEVTSYIRTLGKPDYSFAPEELVHKVEREEEQDDLFEEACRHVAEEGNVSISALQRKYRIGFNRAARLVEMMDAQGFVSEARGTKPRDVFITPEKVEEIFS